ncbi:hypothetical protein B0H11DRAFT_2414537 [Mycena galericulata]|nr:hypothetical protein B0H11DRAFT_2414537 [Mycena galericulata]
MPSLRRSLSSPSVRSAPYPALLSPVLGPRTNGSGHRRSTGSETSIRRVLADIEWWRVADGQRDALPEQESEEHDDLDPEQEGDLLVSEVPVPSVNGAAGELGAEHPSVPVHWSPVSPEMPVDEMAALSIAPATPRRHALESSTSSLESTPEAPEVQAEHPFLDLGVSSIRLQGTDTEVPSPVIGRARSGTSPAFLSARSHSFADFASRERQYADFAMSPLSSPPIFSN